MLAASLPLGGQTLSPEPAAGLDDRLLALLFSITQSFSAILALSLMKSAVYLPIASKAYLARALSFPVHARSLQNVATSVGSSLGFIGVCQTPSSIIARDGVAAAA